MKKIYIEFRNINRKKTKMADTAQPRGVDFQYTDQWSSGLCDCCSDIKTLLCAVCCGACFACELDKDAGVFLN